MAILDIGREELSKGSGKALKKTPQCGEQNGNNLEQTKILASS